MELVPTTVWAQGSVTRLQRCLGLPFSALLGPSRVQVREEVLEG